MKPHTSTMAQTSRLVDALEYQLGDIIILYLLDDEKKALVHPPCQDTQHSVRTDCSVITVGVGTPPLTEQFTSALQSVHHAVTQPNCNPRLCSSGPPVSVCAERHYLQKQDAYTLISVEANRCVVRPERFRRGTGIQFPCTECPLPKWE